MNAHAHNLFAHAIHADINAQATAEHQFVFDLEGQLYELEALSTSLDLLLLDVITEMRPLDRGRAAAIDFAVANLRQQISDLAVRYEQIGQASVRTEAAEDCQRDDRGRFVRQAA